MGSPSNPNGWQADAIASGAFVLNAILVVDGDCVKEMQCSVWSNKTGMRCCAMVKYDEVWLVFGALGVR